MIQPVIFVLMFRYVFGGAIPPMPRRVRELPDTRHHRADGGVRAFATAIALAVELKKGVIDRLRSMPMARVAVLAGRLVADTGRMTGHAS